MPQNMQTTVAGIATGNLTKSGNPTHKANGQFGSGGNKKTKKQIDEDFSVPFCNYKILPTLKQLCNDIDAEIYDIYDPILKISEQDSKEYDKEGTDYFIIKNGKEYSIDLKTSTTGNDQIPDYISIPLWHFDENYKDASTGIKGKQNYGWGLKNNSTKYYLFSLPKEIDKINNFSINEHGNIDFDAFLLSKDKFKEILLNNFFYNENYKDGHEAMFKTMRNMFTVNKNIDFELKKRKKLKDQQDQDLKSGKIKEVQEINLKPNKFQDFDVEYGADGKVSCMTKYIVGKDGNVMSLVMKLKYVPNQPYPRQNIFLRCHKNVFKNNESCQLLNPKENKENVLKNFFGI